MLRVLVADNEPIALKGIKEVIRDAFPDAHVDGSETGRQTLELIEGGSYDLALVDIPPKEMEGLDFLRQIKERKGGLPLLVMSVLPDEQYAMPVIKAGGNGYITKRSTCDELVQAIKKVLSGRRYISPAFAEKFVFDFDARPERPAHERLSNRELEIACMIGRGKSIRTINEELRLSINTVRTYRARILRKIGLKGTNELIHYIVKNVLHDRL